MGECSEQHEAQQVVRELIDELLILAPELAYRRGSNSNVGAASAVLAGLTLLRREAAAEDVTAWLKGIIAELETSGGLPESPQLPAFRARLHSVATAVRD